MKLKIIETKSETIETEFDLPVYFYYQDEDCHDEYVMVTEKEKISVKYTYFGFNISVANHYFLGENDLTCITKKEYFDNFLKEALEDLSKIMN